MSDAAIRPAREADFDDLIALYEEFHAFHVRGVPDRLRLPEPSGDPAAGERERAWMREQLRAILRDPDAALLLAEAGGRIVGLAEVYQRRDEPNLWTVQHTYGHLQSLIVTERWRRRGLGGRLVAAAEAWARERGATQLRLEAWEFAAGPLPFYKSLGYQTVKRELVRPLA
ncbi:MAG TPA: GNAT family N-acetyltransferase [Ktedonobacterales bacterium]|nr:GNAT family N-acetyltransferase [Ktedonobacterales bacterium]